MARTAVNSSATHVFEVLRLVARTDEPLGVSEISRRLGLPVESVPEENFGPFGPIFAMDQPATSARTRDALGWNPTHPSLLEDLENIQP